MGQTFELEDVGARKATSGGDMMVERFMDELDTMRAQVSAFASDDPADVLLALSAISGRLTEMRAQLYRDNSQRCAALRTREVDPLREECELQYKIHSRRIALMEFELRMQGGAC